MNMYMDVRICPISKSCHNLVTWQHHCSMIRIKSWLALEGGRAERGFTRALLTDVSQPVIADGGSGITRLADAVVLAPPLPPNGDADDADCC